VEAWHRAIQSMMGMSHPTIWKFISGLRKMQNKRDGELEQLVAGNPAIGMRRRYKDFNIRIGNVVRDYANRTTTEFLRGIAHNLNF
jgi:hypothetical protein